MALMSITAAVLQLEMSCLKALASRNILSIRVTADVIHLEMSALNSACAANSPCISVTCLMSSRLSEFRHAGSPAPWVPRPGSSPRPPTSGGAFLPCFFWMPRHGSVSRSRQVRAAAS